MEITLNIKNSIILEKTVSKFGNGAHVLIPREYENKKLKIILGKPLRIKGNKIIIDFFGNEILERTVNKFGTGFHITIPKKYLGKKVKIIGEKNEK
jgi:putative transposon-encoded protein